MGKVAERSLANLAPAWQPGQSGNPAGKPKGARTKLQELCLQMLHDDFAIHGVSVIERVRQRRPEAYLSAVVSLLPKRSEKIESPFLDLSDQELEMLEDLLASMRAKTIQAIGPTTPPKPRARSKQPTPILDLPPQLDPDPPKDAA